MLESLRKQTGSWIVKIFLGLLILSFAVWGIGDIFRGSSDSVVANLGEIEISALDFSNTYKRELERINRRMGQRLSSEQAQQLGIPQFTLQNMINQRLIDQAVENYGLIVTDQDLAADIRANPLFQNNLGTFDPSYYRDVLRQLGHTQAYYENNRRRELMREQLVGTIALNADTSEWISDTIFRYRKQKRTAEIITMPLSMIPDPGSPDPLILEKFYQDNSSLYIAPEYRALTFIKMTPQQLLPEITVTDKDLLDEYENRIDDFVTPESRDLSQIFLADEPAARKAQAKLDQGYSFNEVAKTVAGLKPDEIILKDVTIDELPFSASVSDAIFSATKGEIMTAQKSDFGWHIYRIDKVKPNVTRSFEEVRGELNHDLGLDRAGDALFHLANDLEDVLASGATLEEAAVRLNLTIQSISQIDSAGNVKDKATTEINENFPMLLQKAFDTLEGQVSNLTESSDQGYFIVRVDSVTLSSIKPLNSVTEQVINDWKIFYRSAGLKDRAKTIANGINEGKKLSEIPFARGLKAKRSEPLIRFSDNSNKQISQELLEKLFALKTLGKAVESPTPNKEGHVVAVLKSIETPIPGGVENDKLRSDISHMVAEDILAQYRLSLNAGNSLKVNQSTFDSLFQ